MKTAIVMLLGILGLMLASCVEEETTACEDLCDQIGKCADGWDNTAWSSNDDCVADCEDDPTPDAANNQCANDCTDKYSDCGDWAQCIVSCE